MDLDILVQSSSVQDIIQILIQEDISETIEEFILDQQ